VILTIWTIRAAPNRATLRVDRGGGSDAYHPGFTYKTRPARLENHAMAASLDRPLIAMSAKAKRRSKTQA